MSIDNGVLLLIIDEAIICIISTNIRPTNADIGVCEKEAVTLSTAFMRTVKTSCSHKVLFWSLNYLISVKTSNKLNMLVLRIRFTTRFELNLEFLNKIRTNMVVLQWYVAMFCFVCRFQGFFFLNYFLWTCNKWCRNEVVSNISY